MLLEKYGLIYINAFLKKYFSSFRCNTEKSEFATFCSSNMDGLPHDIYSHWVHSAYC